MKNLFDEATMGAIVIISMFVVMFSTLKVLVTSGERRSFRKVIVSFLIAVPVGLIAGLVSFEWGLGQFTSCLIASFATLLSEQIVLAIVNNKLNISQLIERITNNLVDKWTK